MYPYDAAGIRRKRSLARVSALLLISALTYVPGLMPFITDVFVAEADDPVALDTSLYVNGEVHTTKTATDGTTYFGGQFTFVGPFTGPGVPVNTTTGQRLGSYHRILSHGFSTTTGSDYAPWVDKAVSDGNGGWYVAGALRGSNNSTYDAIRINGSGTVSSTFAVTANGQVRTMALSPDGNTLYIGGNFTNINGSTRAGLAAVDADTGALSSWDPAAVGFVLFGSSPAYIDAMDVASDGTVYVGGNFQTIGGQTRHGLAALDPSTALATAWNPRPYSCNGACNPGGGSQEMVSTIDDIEIDGSDVYVAGSWYSINGFNGVMLKRFAKLNNTNGDVASGWTTDSTSRIEDIVVSSDAVYVGGWINSIGGQPRIGLAKMSKAGVVSSWNANAAGSDIETRAMVLSADESTLYFTGGFYFVNGIARARAAAVSTSDGSLTSWNPSLDGTDYWDDSGRTIALNSDGNSIYIGGFFQSVNGYTRDDIFSVDSSGNVTAFNPKVDVDWVVGDGSYTIVYAITTDPGNTKVYFGGDFGMVNGEYRYYLAAANASDGSLLGWNPDPDDIIMALETNEDGSVIFAGGDGISCLNNYGDCTFQGFVPIQASTGLRLQGWGDGGTGYWGDSVLSIKRSGSKLYIGGDFYEIGQTNPVVRMGVAQLDINTGAVTNWNAGLDSSAWSSWVNDIAVDVTGVYVGGSFTDVGCDEFDNNCTSRRNFAKFHRTTGAVLPFDPNPDGIVYDIETNGPTIYVAGEFLNIGGASRARLAALDYSLATNNATSWNPGIDATSTSSYIEPKSLSKNGDTLYVGGYFVNAGSGVHPNLAAFTVDDNPELALTPQAQFATSTGSGYEKTSPVLIPVDLNTELSATATVDYAVTGGTAPGGTRYSLAPGTLTFAPNVTTAYVPLSVVSDTAIRPDQTVEITLSNPTGMQLGSTTVFTYTIEDGTATTSGVTVVKPGGAINLTEGGPSGSYTIVLNTQPTADVDIRITSDAFSTTTQKTLTFTPSNWSTPQTVTVTAIDNPSYVGLHGSRITHIASSSDPLYNGITIARVSLTINDDLAAPSYMKQDEQSWWINDNYSPAINQALTAPDGTTYLAGRFTYVGKITYFGALLRKDTGYPDFPFPYIRYTPGGEDTYGDSGVYAVIPDGEGGWYVGGAFGIAGSDNYSYYVNGFNNTINSFSRRNLVHVLKNGTVDPNWDPDPVGSVYALERDPKTGTLYVGGAFTSIGGKPRNYIAALNPDGTAKDEWNPDANGAVTSIKMDGTDVYVGGRFTTIGNNSRNRLAKLDDCGIAAAWNPNANGEVSSLALYSGKLYAGGQFTQMGGVSKPFLASFATSTGAMDSWAPNPYNSPQEPGYVRTMLVDGSTLYIGGDFLSVQGLSRSLVAAIDLATGNVTGWNPPAISTTASGNPNVQAMALNGNELLVGGFFNSVGSFTKNYFNLVAFDKTTGATTTWAAMTDDPFDYNIRALASDDDHIYVGGDFRSVGGRRRYNLAAIDSSGNLTPFAPRIETYSIFDGTMYSLALKDNVLYAGGNLGDNLRTGSIWGKVNDRPQFALMSFDLSQNGALTSFNPEIVAEYTLYYGNDTSVNTMKVLDNTLYIGGAFNFIASSTRRQLAAFDVTDPLNPTLTSWTADLGASLGGSYAAYSIEGAGNTIYVGGGIASVNGTTQRGIVALDKTTGAKHSWSPLTRGYQHVNTFGRFYRLYVMGNSLYYTGDVAWVGTSTNPTVGGGVFDISSTTNPVVQPWNPDLKYIYSGGTVSTTSDAALAFNGTEMYIGGTFNRIEGQTRSKLAKYDITNPLAPVLTSTLFQPSQSSYSPKYLMYSNGVLWHAANDTFSSDFWQYGLVDDADPTRLGFSQDFATAPVAASTEQLEVSIEEASSTPIAASYSVVGGDAIAGVDYSLAPGTVTIATGDTTGYILLDILPTATAGRSLRLALSGPTAGADLDQSTMDFEIGYVYTAPTCITAACGATLVPSSISATQGDATTTFTVVLDSQPTADVTVSVTPDSYTTASPATLTFTTLNWSTPQPVSVRARTSPAIVSTTSAQISLAASSADTDYNGLDMGSVSMTIAPTPPAGSAPSIGSFSASPTSIASGQSSTLSWSITGATSVSINQGVGSQGSLSSGSVSVSPTVTTTYTLTAANAYGTANSTASVTVTAAGTTTPSGGSSSSGGSGGSSGGKGSSDKKLVPIESYVSRDLKENDKGSDAAALNKFLDNNSLADAKDSKEGIAVVGKETAAGIAALKESHGSDFGSTDTTGAFDKKTEAYVNSTKAANDLYCGTQEAPVFAAAPELFTEKPKKNSKGGEVRMLQRFLNSNGYSVATSGPGSLGSETDSFGDGTSDALERFQKAHAKELKRLGRNTATGELDFQTRNLINAARTAPIIECQTVIVDFETAASGGSEGISEATTTLRLSAASLTNVIVKVFPFDVTAIRGIDYLRESAKFVFQPGVVAKSVVSSILNDASREDTELFGLKLEDPKNATIGANLLHVRSIVDDDTPILPPSPPPPQPTTTPVEPPPATTTPPVEPPPYVPPTTDVGPIIIITQRPIQYPLPPAPEAPTSPEYPTDATTTVPVDAVMVSYEIEITEPTDEAVTLILDPGPGVVIDSASTSDPVIVTFEPDGDMEMAIEVMVVPVDDGAPEDSTIDLSVTSNDPAYDGHIIDPIVIDLPDAPIEDEAAPATVPPETATEPVIPEPYLPVVNEPVPMSTSTEPVATSTVPSEGEPTAVVASSESGTTAEGGDSSFFEFIVNAIRAGFSQVGGAITTATDGVAENAYLAVALVGFTSMLAAAYGATVARLTGRIKSYEDLKATIIRLVTELFGVFGYKKGRRVWGTVYDSVTKLPIDPAIVTLIDVNTGSVIEEAVTDLAGRYGFLVRKGAFRLYAQKTNYVYPSAKETGSTDEIYDNLYHGETIVISDEADVVAPNIPMDPVSFDWSQSTKTARIKQHPRLRFFARAAVSVLFWVGFAWTLFATFAYPSNLNYALLASYIVVYIITLLVPAKRLWGRVYAARGGEALPGLVIELAARATDMPVVMGRAKSGRDGKFFLKANPGTYDMRVIMRPGTEHQKVVHSSVVTVDKEGLWNKDIVI